MNLFLSQPTIYPREYLSTEDAAKVAAVRMQSPPAYWDDEIRQVLLREHPYIPSDRVVVNFTKRDDATGTGMGYVSLAGSPGVNIPVIIKNRELAPLDILVLQSTGGDGQQQGSGDMTDDKVLPLNEDTFNQAMDAGPVGDAVPTNSTTGTAYTEDASSLRLPFRGRTVTASVAKTVGVTDAQKEALSNILSKHANAREMLTGFTLNNSTPIIESWLTADAPKRTWQNKIAAQQVALDTAVILAGAPDTIGTADFRAADIYLDDETSKVACTLEAMDLSRPEAGLRKFLVFADGSYCHAPEKVAGHKLAEADAANFFDKLVGDRQAPALRVGSNLMFVMDGVCSTPAKIASVSNHSDKNSVLIRLTNDSGSTYDVLLDKRIKEATFAEDTRTWILPLSVRVLTMGDWAAEAPMQPEKVASTLQRQLTDSLVVSDGQWTLTVRGMTVGVAGMPEAKMAELLNANFTNGEEMMNLTKAAAAQDIGAVGLLRFGSDYGELQAERVKQAGLSVECDKVCSELAADIRIPLERAVKLASAIGDPEGVDAILGAGFLTEDNLSEFVSLSGQFEETVSKLARLLLAVRMGFPGDETATVVAMKSLSRVAERLQSAGQEV